MKNDPRRQEAIANLFHVSDRDKVLDGQKNDPRRQEAIANLFHVRDSDKVGGQDVKEK